jgi:hypothetical protein
LPYAVIGATLFYRGLQGAKEREPRVAPGRVAPA